MGLKNLLLLRLFCIMFCSGLESRAWFRGRLGLGWFMCLWCHNAARERFVGTMGNVYMLFVVMYVFKSSQREGEESGNVKC